MQVKMTGLLDRSWKVVARVWTGIREWCGDAAYERYLKAHAKHGCGAAVLMSREEFYVEQLQKRYSRVSRCC